MSCDQVFIYKNTSRETECLREEPMSNRGRARARSPEEQAKVRRRFVDCARAVFAKEGAHGLTMRRLAAEAGYSPGTIYLYFPGRSELLREVWKEDLVALRDTMTRAVEDAGRDPVERLRALLWAYARFWFEQPDHFKAMFLEVERQYVSERAAFAEDDSVQEVHRLLREETGKALAEGRLQGDDVNVVCQSLLAAVHGVVALHIGNAGFPWSPRDRMVDTVLSGMLRGLAPA